jgi:hypothetical protein
MVTRTDLVCFKLTSKAKIRKWHISSRNRYFTFVNHQQIAAEHHQPPLCAQVEGQMGHDVQVLLIW